MIWAKISRSRQSVFVTATAVVLIGVNGAVAQAVDPQSFSSPGTNAVIGQSQLPTVVVTGEIPLDQASAYDQQHEASNEIDVLSRQNIEQTSMKPLDKPSSGSPEFRFSMIPASLASPRSEAPNRTWPNGTFVPASADTISTATFKWTLKLSMRSTKISRFISKVII
jgi:hypothetical protein